MLGVRLAVDDYGTGYASLAYLSTLPVHDLKLDKSFVIAMGGDGQDAERARSIVASTVTLSNALGLDLIAEGVETAEILTQLRELGCTAAPGLPHKPAVDVHRAHCLARSPRTGTRRSQLMHRASRMSCRRGDATVSAWWPISTSSTARSGWAAYGVIDDVRIVNRPLEFGSFLIA